MLGSKNDTGEINHTQNEQAMMTAEYCHKNNENKNNNSKFLRDFGNVNCKV